MVFSSVSFLLYFLPVFLGLYFAAGTRRIRNAVLLAASLFFYSWGEPIWVSLLFVSAATDYLCGRVIHANPDRPARRRLALIVSIAVNLGLLGVFKYQGFFARNLGALLSVNLPYREIALPIGISFYTFQTMTYTIDLYRGKASVQRSFANFLLYVSLFPQLVAGPIVRYADIEREITDRRESVPLFAEGLKRFIAGFAKKVVLANTAGAIGAIYLDADPQAITALAAWTGVLLFSFQIYFDFSGYSDMAIGLGRMLGFHFKENFDYPLTSESIGEMWRRWHISLSSFFRDYVYIPLGGGRSHYLRNMAVVWFLTGLWHGASWNFIFWGLYFGLFIVLERLALNRYLIRAPRLLRRAYYWIVATFGWTFFYFTDSGALMRYIRAMFGGGAGFVDALTLRFLAGHIVFLAVCAVASTPVVRRIWRRSRAAAVPFLEEAVCLLTFGLSFLLMVGQSYNPFLYFRF